MNRYPFIQKIIIALLILFTFAGTGAADLTARYYNEPIYKHDINATAVPNITKIDPNVDFVWHSQSQNNPLPLGIMDDGEWAIDWTGYLIVTKSGSHYFRLNSDDGSWLFIDDVMVVDNGGDHPPKDAEGSINLEPGAHRIQVKYYETLGGEANINLYWGNSSGNDYIIPEGSLSPVPELPTFLLIGAGLIALIGLGRRK